MRTDFVARRRPTKVTRDGSAYRWLGGLLFVYAVAVLIDFGGDCWLGAIVIFGGTGVLWALLTVLAVQSYTMVRRKAA